MSDLLLDLLVIGGFYGGIFATGWTAYLIFSWIGNRLPWRKPPSWAVGSSLSPAPFWALDPFDASYQRTLREWGTTIINTGYEAGCGWNILLFKIDPAVAGVREVMTVSGEAMFTPGQRCMIVVDREQITVLDREQQRGIRLESDWPREGFQATLEGTSLRIRYFQQSGGDGDGEETPRYSELVFSIDLHSESGLELVPAGWPGTVVMLPEQP